MSNCPSGSVNVINLNLDLRLASNNINCSTQGHFLMNTTNTSQYILYFFFFFVSCCDFIAIFIFQFKYFYPLQNMVNKWLQSQYIFIRNKPHFILFSVLFVLCCDDLLLFLNLNSKYFYSLSLWVYSLWFTNWWFTNR